MKSEQEIDALVRRAVDAGLEGLDFLSSFTYAELAAGYNGIGPEWAGERIREFVTGEFGVFEPAAMLHDMRNHVADGTEAAFHYANGEFLLNCLKLAKREWPWWSPRRYAAIAAANGMFDLVEGPGGWRAWQEAHARHLQRISQDPQDTQDTQASSPRPGGLGCPGGPGTPQTKGTNR